MPIKLNPQEIRFLQDVVGQFSHSFATDELQPVLLAMHFGPESNHIAPQFVTQLLQLKKALEGSEKPGDFYVLDDDYAPMIKLAVLAGRRVRATSVDERKAKTNNSEIVARLDAELASYDDMLAKDWLEHVNPERMPRLADYLTLEEVERHFARGDLQLRPRQYDEKFHMLQAPTLLVPDITYYRGVNAARGNVVAVAYLDIDDFKKLNTKYGHPVVDATVLPVFMRALESFTFARGYAYRLSGDEYAVLLANGRGAASILQEFQKGLAAVRYHNVEEKLSVSVGLCEVTVESYLSDQAVVERANFAMRRAKKQRGKNRIATYAGDGRYRDDDVVLVPRH